MAESSSSNSYLVVYCVRGEDRTFSAGPYTTYEEAIDQKNDIAGYEGIYDAKIVPNKNNN